MGWGTATRTSLKPVVPTLLRVLRLAWEASPSAFGWTVAISGLTALIPPLIVWFGKELVDLVVAGAERGQTSATDLLPTVVGLGVAAAVLRALNTVQANRQIVFAASVELHAERNLLQRVAAADIGYFEQSEWHDRVSRATSDLNWRPYSLALALVNMVASSITLAGMLLLLISLSPLLALLAFASALPSAYAQRRVGRQIYEFWRHTTSDDRRRKYLRDILSRPQTAKEVRAYGLRDHLLARHLRVSEDRLSGMRRLHARGERLVLVTALVTGGALAAAYGLVAERGLSGQLTAGDLTLLIGAFGAASGQMTALLASVLELDRGAAFLEDYFSLLTIEPLVPVRDDPTPLPAELAGGVRFDAVSFTYPGASEPSLRDVSFSIEPGQLLALVGENGSGKTTIVKLLLRFYDPDAGTVSVGGVDVRETDPTELRRRIGALFQDFAQYDFTIRDNVGLGRVNRDPTDEAVMAALRASRAEYLVGGDRGLDFHVGRMFDDSHDLSGGEWQRLALARVLFRDADIWVLDEPTSALDAEAEASVFATLRLLLKDRIGIVISHRFSTVRVADRIAVMAGGRITESGTHEELIAADGTYARLFELQAAGYR